MPHLLIEPWNAGSAQTVKTRIFVRLINQQSLTSIMNDINKILAFLSPFKVAILVIIINVVGIYFGQDEWSPFRLIPNLLLVARCIYAVSLPPSRS